METDPSGGKGVDVPAYAEIDVPTPSLETKLALYEVQREKGAEPEEPLETELLAKQAREAQDESSAPADVPAYAETVATGVDVPAYAVIDAPTPSLETRLALYRVQREKGAEPEEPLETELQREMAEQEKREAA